MNIIYGGIRLNQRERPIYINHVFSIDYSLYPIHEVESEGEEDESEEEEEYAYKRC